MSSSERRRWPHARFQESNTEKAPQTATAAKLTIDSGSAHERQNSQRGNLSTTQEAARGPQRVCWGGGGGRDEHPPSNPCRNNEQLHCNCTATGFALSRVCIGAAKGRSSLARSRWPDAQIEVAVAKWDLGKEQQREKREKRREKRDGSVPEGRDGGEKGRPLGERREERKEKREERDKHNQDERAEESNISVPEW